MIKWGGDDWREDERCERVSWWVTVTGTSLPLRRIRSPPSEISNLEKLIFITSGEGSGVGGVLVEYVSRGGRSD